jgi:putative membrane protein
MFRTTLIVGAALSALIVAACSKPAPKTDATADATTPAAAPAATPAPAPAPAAMTAADFVTKAASTDMFEIAEAKMAEKKATSPDVKKFAAMMIKDHTKSTADLKAAIAKSGQSLTPPPALPADMQSKVDDLGKTSGADFDKTYITQQVDAHTTALGVMQGYAMGGDVPALKDFATATSKVVQMHLDMANKLQASMTK